MKKFIIVIAIIIAAVVGCVLGYAVGYSRGGNDVAASYAPKIAAVSKLFRPIMQTSYLTGRVDTISGDTVTVDANPITMNPFAEGNFPVVRTVTVTDATVITRTEQKDPAVFQEEVEAFQKMMQGGSVPPGIAATGTAHTAIATNPPTMFSETTTTLSDIKVGDTITITAASDISSATSFSATKIQIMPVTSTANPAIPLPSTAQ